MTASNDVKTKFLEFDWSDERWQKYLQGLYPVPNAKQIMKYKKKWFHKNIDPSFDPQSNVGEEPSVTEPPKSASAAGAASSSGASQARPTPSVATSGSGSVLLRRVTAVLLAMGVVLTVCSLLPTPLKARLRAAGIAGQVIGLCAAMVLKEGRPVMSGEYWERAFMSDALQGVMMAMVAFPVQSSWVLASPTISSAIAMCSAANGLPELAAFRQYTEQVTNNTYQLLQRKADIEVIIGVVMLFMGLSRRIHFLSVLIYWNVLRVKVTANPFTKSTFSTTDRTIRTYLSHPAAPPVLLNIYEKVSGVLYRFANPTPPART